MPFKFSFVSILVCCLGILTVAAQDYSITAYGVDGTGCPPGTATVTPSTGNQELAVTYTQFTANVSPNTAPHDTRKNCAATLTINVPAGKQFAFSNFSYTAGYTLGPGVRAIYQTQYYFQSQLPEGAGRGYITGAASDDSDVLSNTVTPTVWSQCGGSTVVNVNTDIRAAKGPQSGSGRITFKSLYIPKSTFVWRSC